MQCALNFGIWFIMDFMTFVWVVKTYCNKYYSHYRVFRCPLRLKCLRSRSYLPLTLHHETSTFSPGP